MTVSIQFWNCIFNDHQWSCEYACRLPLSYHW